MTIVAAAVAAPLWWQFAPPPKDIEAGAVLVASILFSGMALSPDLDLDSSVYRRWGPLRFIWWPYQKIVRHRSWVSHSFLLGPLIRIAYFLFFLWALFRCLSYLLAFVIPLDRNAISRQWVDTLLHLPQTHPQHFQMLLLGLFLGAALHTGADIVVSSLKPRRRKR